MAKGNGKTQGDDSGIEWDKKEIEHIYARSMNDHEVLVGRYLGYDFAKTRHGERIRHQFMMGDGKIEARFGMVILDSKLSKCTLGRMTRVECLGPLEFEGGGQRRGRQSRRDDGRDERTVDFAVVQGGDVVKDGIIDRMNRDPIRFDGGNGDDRYDDRDRDRYRDEDRRARR